MTLLLPPSKNGKIDVRVYKLSKQAEQDLTAIWEYTVEQWNEAQADAYLQAIQSAMRLLIDNPEIGTSRENIRTGYRSHCFGKHIIFYRSYSYGIRVIRILHQSMECERHLL